MPSSLISPRNIPIAKKLVIFFLMTLLVTMTVAFLAIIQFDRMNFREVIENEISILAAVISNRSTAAVIFDDRELAQNNLKPLVFRESIEFACIYKVETPDQNSKVTTTLATYPAANGSCPNFTPAKTYIFEDQNAAFLEFIEPIILDNNIIGYLYLRSSLDELNKRLARNWRIFGFVFLIAAVIGFVIANFFAGTISRPLSSLGQTALSIARSDDYSLRAKKYSEDEIGQVVDSFNRMLTVIEDEHAKLSESEEKFRLISASSRVGIFQLDLQGNYLYVNEELCQITGLDHDEIMEHGWINAVHPDDLQGLSAKWRNMLANQQEINLNSRLKGTETQWVTGHVSLLHRGENELVGYIGTISDITEVKNAQLQLEHMAFYDTLTGLANRRLFRNRLEHVLHNIVREGSCVGLILLDLDHFKNINDTLGHDSGDSLLVIIAERLQHCVRSSDTVARLGGDEFAIILPHINSSLAISTVAEKVLETLKQAIVLRETEVQISTSLGLAMAPDDSNSAEELIKCADLALYRAKDQGRNNYQFFTQEMNTQLVDHLNLIRDLRNAITAREFLLVYQPQVALDDGRLVGFEALIRWENATRGMVNPMDFIPVAEETGMIIPIGRWVIRTACETLRTLCDRKLVSENVVMTVNLSVKQFQDEQLVSYIDQCINEFRLQPAQFEIELTETVLMENLDEALQKLESLKSLGIMISIDDFGTGYSSLGYLKRLPVNILKVDRSFVNDIPHDRDDMEITAAVIAMAHSLNYIVVAEGVETREQLEFLRGCDCDYGQGYYFSRPLAYGDLPDYCQRNADRRAIG